MLCSSPASIPCGPRTRAAKSLWSGEKRKWRARSRFRTNCTEPSQKPHKPSKKITGCPVGLRREVLVGSGPSSLRPDVPHRSQPDGAAEIVGG